MPDMPDPMPKEPPEAKPDAPAGAVLRPEPGLRLVRAPNPSPMTGAGTNSWILGEGEVALIDPGPALPEHQAALLAALEPGERISHILVTHAHVDHSPLARPLSEATGAPVLAFGPPEAGRSALMQDLARRGLAGGGEGVDRGFSPDIRLREGSRIAGRGWEIEALHTPGHMGNHMCFRWGDALFCGDHVLGWASTFVSPPDGDIAAFMQTTGRLRDLGARIFYPGHGDPIEAPAERCAWLLEHRRQREAQILEALAQGPADTAAIAARIYDDIPPAMLAAAARNVFAHLVDLAQRKLILPRGEIMPEAVFERP